MSFLTKNKSIKGDGTGPRFRMDVLAEQFPQYMQWTTDITAAKHPAAVLEIGPSPEAPIDLTIRHAGANMRYRDAKQHLGPVQKAKGMFWTILENETDLRRRHVELAQYIEDYAEAPFNSYLLEELKIAQSCLDLLKQQIGRVGPVELRTGNAALLGIMIDLWREGDVAVNATADERDAWVGRYVEAPSLDMFSGVLIVDPDDALNLASDALNQQSLTKLQYVRALYNEGDASYQEKLGPAILETNNTIRRLQFKL